MKRHIYTGMLSVLIIFYVGCAGDTNQSMDADTTAVTDTADMAMTHPGMEDMAAGDTLYAALTGDAEVPESGDPDGSGTANVVLNSEDGTVCFEITVENIEEPTAAHIHTGAAGTAGPPVVNFDIGNLGLSGCVDADVVTIEAIQMAPSEYYVNVHNAEYGGGAARGQLGMDSGEM